MKNKNSPTPETKGGWYFVVAIIMAIVGIVFLAYSIGHPEASFGWSNTITYTLYSLYVLVVFVLLFIGSKRR